MLYNYIINATTMANFQNEGFQIHDDYMTPRYAWEDIKEYIPNDKQIWEAFYGDGKSGDHLKDMGFDVLHAPVDFFCHDWGDIIVTNPPFSKTKEVMKRLFELDKPFIVILPSSKINTQYFREWKDKNLQLIIPKKRISFNKIVGCIANGWVEVPSQNCNFDCFYYCYKMNLPKDIVWL